MSVPERTASPPPEVAEAPAAAPSVRARPRLRQGARILGAVAVVAFLYALAPLYADEFLLTFLIDVLLFGLVALGLQHMVGDGGVLNLGQAAFFGLGTFGGLYAVQHWGWTTVPAMAAAIALALVGAAVMLPLLRLRGIYFAMASFAFGAFMFEAFNRVDRLTGGADGLVLLPGEGLNVFGWEPVGNRDPYLVVLTTAVIMYAVFAVLARTGYGLSLHAVRQSEAGARAAGVNVARMHVLAVCLGVVPAAIAGLLYAQIRGFVSAAVFDYEQSVTLITMVIVGGVLSRWGAFAGAFFALYLSTYQRDLFGIDVLRYQLLFYGLVIAVFMVLLPDGFAGLVRRLARLAGRLGAQVRT